MTRGMNVTAESSATSATAKSLAALERYPEPIRDVSPRDHMYNSATEPKDHSYHTLGRLALDCVRSAMVTAQMETARSILDLPSGHGRVLRHLKAEFPEARLTACDIDHDGVDYCAKTFGATPLYGREGTPDPVEGQFDLIWCGSLLTHLDAPEWEEFLAYFEAALMPRGLLVFTTHGRSIAHKLRDPEWGAQYVPNTRQTEEIVRGYDEQGFGFADYGYGQEVRDSLSLPSKFGISASKPSWVCQLIERRPHLLLLSYTENRWGAHDVVACVRVEAVEEPKTPFRIPYPPRSDRPPPPAE
jgi:SAM-dependent methyltransferase